MRRYAIPRTDLMTSRIGYGGVRLSEWDRNPLSANDILKTATLIHTARDCGINLFDHADVYAFGKAETAFGAVLSQSPGLRDTILIQTKCGQILPCGWQPGQMVRVNLSRDHIVKAVEGSLQRLRTEYLDILLLHAPDALMQPEEIAQAFDDLHGGGRVRYFGVSNFHEGQIELLKKEVRQPIVINQIRLSLTHAYSLMAGLEFTLQLLGSPENLGITPSGLIEYCRLQQIQIQAWSPLAGLMEMRPDTKPVFHRTKQLLDGIAKQRGTTPHVIALAWLLKHPAGIVPITGAGKAEHLIENCDADEVMLSREEWNDLFVAAASDLQLRDVRESGAGRCG